MSQLSGMSDAVLDSRIETSISNGGNEFLHIKLSLGSSVMRRQLRTEETWSPRRLLGRGSFGKVWLQECVAGNPRKELRAVKEITKHQMKTSYVFRELETIAKFSQEKYAHCFVRSSGWFETESSWFIAMEYMPYGDLHQAVSTSLAEPEARQIIFQTVEGVSFMHGSGFAHRDLKPSNIMVFRPGPSWWVKITDFGISKRTNDLATGTLEIGTAAYMAPELRHMYSPEDDGATGGHRDHPNAVDIWAVGEITHRLLTHAPLFPSGLQLFNYVVKGTPFPFENLQKFGCSQAGMDFVARCMPAAPARRLTAMDALAHSWLVSHEFINEPADANPQTYQKTNEPVQATARNEPSARWSTAYTAQGPPEKSHNPHLTYGEPSARWPSSIGTQQPIDVGVDNNHYGIAYHESAANRSSTSGTQRPIDVGVDNNHYGTANNEPSAKWPSTIGSQWSADADERNSSYSTPTLKPVPKDEDYLPDFQRPASLEKSPFFAAATDNILRDRALFPWAAADGRKESSHRPLTPPLTVTKAASVTPLVTNTSNWQRSNRASNVTNDSQRPTIDLFLCPVKDCPHRKQGFAKQNRLKKHMETAHPDYGKPKPRKPTGFTCPVQDCRRNINGFGSEERLKRHIEGAHGEQEAPAENGFTCSVDDCSFQHSGFSSIVMLNNHIEGAHSSELEEVKTGYVCRYPGCDRRYHGFPTKALLGQHAAKTHPTHAKKGTNRASRFTCPVKDCFYSQPSIGFFSMNQLDDHIAISHSGR